MGIKRERSCGILLHISSLPGKYGIGTLGKEAYDFVDLLSCNGVGYWQILPLVQTGYGDSPYQSVFSGSGNPYFIDLKTLADEKLLKRSELSMCRFDGKKIDYSFLYEKKYALLRRAFSRFDRKNEVFQRFIEEGKFQGYALFQTLKGKFGQTSFCDWPQKYKFAREKSLRALERDNREEVEFWLFLQFEFLKQWKALKAYANAKGVRIIGDLPLYVAYDSVDVWLHPQYFKLDSKRRLKKVAGVPPDYFSETGQLWGNPVYNWSRHKKEGYSWWIERLKNAFELYDVVRIDHFRGFDRYYEIDAGEDTAKNGKWVKGPGMDLFAAIRAELGEVDLVAEDLGLMDAGVLRLIRGTGFPGMKVMQFAFDGDPKNRYLPKKIEENSICYTGTHDNDTMVGFLASMDEASRLRFKTSLRKTLKEQGLEQTGSSVKQQAKAVMELVMKCRSYLSILPVQDLLFMGAEARMNVPATKDGNWQFRLGRPVTDKQIALLRSFAEKYGRSNLRK